MSMSLRDQLLQAGLISKKQAQQAGKQQHQHKKGLPPKNPAEAPDIAKLAAEKALAEKVAQDQERSRKEREKAEIKARFAQIKQLVDQHKLPKVNGEDYYNFADGKKIRRIPVTPAMRAQLGQGQLAIVRSDGRYEVVSNAIADRVRERDERSVIHYGPAQAPTVDENDPYKDFVVPDDLIW